MKDHWGEGPRGWYHRKCYQIYTMKRNLNLRKRKFETEKRDSWTPKPANLPRTFDKSKCIVCLNDKHQDSKRLNLEKLSQCLTEEAIENMKLAGTHQNDACLVKRLDRSDSTVLYHRSCYKKLTKCLYRTDDNDSKNSSKFDISFEKFAKDVDTNIIKALKVVSLSALMSRFVQILKEEGIDSPNYKPSYLKNRLQKHFGNNISFWRSKGNTTYTVYCDNVPKGQIIEAAIASTSSGGSNNLLHVNERETGDEDVAIHLYYAAKVVRGLILSEAKSSVPWPPTGDSIDEGFITIPDLLYNWFAWVATDQTEDVIILAAKVSTPEPIHRSIVSFAQDLIYTVSRGRVKTPKHVGLSVLVKSQTGSAEVVKILNRFGHRLSYDQLEEIETAVASGVAQRSDDTGICIPSNIKGGVFTSFCWDNNDLLEETLSGSGTTHCTNGIVIQRQSDWCENQGEVLQQYVGTRKRSLMVDSTQNLDVFHSGRRSGPNEKLCVIEHLRKFEEISKYAVKTDFCFFSLECLFTRTCLHLLIQISKYLHGPHLTLRFMLIMYLVLIL